MRARSSKSVGALHPILFFAVVYVVVLFLSIFICSSLFYSMNSDVVSTDRIEHKTIAPETAQKPFPVQVSTAVVIR